MNLFFKIIISFFLFTPSLMAGGECEGSGAAHTNFCSGKNKQICNVHSSVCSWKETEVKEVRVINSKKSCVAKEGSEAHESFCNSHSKQICRVHSNMCTWQ